MEFTQIIAEKFTDTADNGNQRNGLRIEICAISVFIGEDLRELHNNGGVHFFE